MSVSMEKTRHIVEKFDKKEEPIEIETTCIKQSVMITHCKESTVVIKGKCGNVIVESCEKVGVVFESCIAPVEVIKCKKCQLQVQGTVPAFNIEKSEGTVVYLNKESINCEFYTTGSFETNINIPKEDDDMIESAVPETIQSHFKDGKLVSEVLVHVS